jgi:hypothetical protein
MHLSPTQYSKKIAALKMPVKEIFKETRKQKC